MTAAHGIAKKLKHLNSRISPELEKEEAGIAKLLRKPRFTPLDGLEYLYGFIDRYLAHTQGFVPCQAGCAYCCHMKVSVSTLEADYIAKKTLLSVSAQSNFRMVTEDYCDPLRPCPFLNPSSNRCVIHQHRPLVCRTYLSLEDDNLSCRFENDTTQIVLLERTSTLPGAMRAYRELVARYNGTWADIREFFGSREYL